MNAGRTAMVASRTLVAAVLVVPGVAACGPEYRPRNEVGSASTQPGNRIAPVLGTSSTTTAPHTTVPGTAVTVTSDPPSPPTVPLTLVADHIARSLPTVQSFRATATVTRRMEPGTTSTQALSESSSTNTVTLFGDGRAWVTTEHGWASFDPSTGTARASNGGHGAPPYQEIAGWSDYAVGLQMFVGHDPVPRLDIVDPSAEVVEVEFDGRPAWQITWPSPDVGPSDRTTTLVIDQATGLIVATRNELVVDGDRQITDSSLTALEIGVELPEDYPGTFPEGAIVERSGDPAAYRTTTAAEAAELFGSGFVVPSGLPETARMVATSAPVASETGADFATDVGVTITIPVGFARSVIELHKFVPLEGTTPGFGMIPAGDGLCFTQDGTTCTVDRSGPTIESGALAGHTFQASGTGSSLSVNTGAFTLAVIATSPEEALSLVNSLMSPN